MEQSALKKNMWNMAGVSGLALGAVSSAYLFASHLLAGSLAPAALWQQVVGMILWTAKFVGCIWLMKFFMTKFARNNEGADNRMTFRMGMASALLSGLLFSAAALADMLYISADFYDSIYQELFRQMSPMMDSNTTAAFEKTIAGMPQIYFFYNLIYCFMYGTVLSAILSRNIPAKDPFAEYKPDEQ